MEANSPIGPFSHHSPFAHSSTFSRILIILSSFYFSLLFIFFFLFFFFLLSLLHPTFLWHGLMFNHDEKWCTIKTTILHDCLHASGCFVAFSCIHMHICVCMYVYKREGWRKKKAKVDWKSKEIVLFIFTTPLLRVLLHCYVAC